MDLSILFLILVIMILNSKTILTKLDLDHNRVKDYYAFLGVMFFIMLLTDLIFHGPVYKNLNILAFGALFGIPVAIVSDHFYFNQLETLNSNVMIQEEEKKMSLITMIFIITPLIISTVWFVFEDNKENASIFLYYIEKYIIPFMAGAMIPGLIIPFIDILKYEKKNGILYLREKDTRKKDQTI